MQVLDHFRAPQNILIPRLQALDLVKCLIAFVDDSVCMRVDVIEDDV